MSTDTAEIRLIAYRRDAPGADPVGEIDLTAILSGTGGTLVDAFTLGAAASDEVHALPACTSLIIVSKDHPFSMKLRSGETAMAKSSRLRAGSRPAAWRKASIDNASGVKWLVHMLDGSNLSKGKHLLKPPAVGGWPSLRVGIVSCHETEEIFPGSNVDFGAKIGMQEQAAVRAAAEDF